MHYFNSSNRYITFFFWGFAIRKFTNRVGDGAIMVLFIWSHFYFFVLNSGLIRIFISLPLGLISLHFLLKNDLRKYLLFIALASVIHMSALVMLLLLPFLLNKDYYYKHWHSFVIISFLVVIISLLSMAAYLVPLLGDRYEGYGEVSDMSLSIGTFTTIPIFIAIYYYYKNMSFESVYAKKKFILGMVLIALSVVFSIATSMVHVGRISFYTYLGFLIVIPQIFRATARGIIGFLLKYLLIIYPLVYVMGTNMLNTAKTQLFPFKSFVNF